MQLDCRYRRSTAYRWGSSTPLDDIEGKSECNWQIALFLVEVLTRRLWPIAQITHPRDMIHHHLFILHGTNRSPAPSHLQGML